MLFIASTTSTTLVALVKPLHNVSKSTGETGPPVYITLKSPESPSEALLMPNLLELIETPSVTLKTILSFMTTTDLTKLLNLLVESTSVFFMVSYILSARFSRVRQFFESTSILIPSGRDGILTSIATLPMAPEAFNTPDIRIYLNPEFNSSV